MAVAVVNGKVKINACTSNGMLRVRLDISKTTWQARMHKHMTNAIALMMSSKMLTIIPCSAPTTLCTEISREILG